MYTVCIYIHDRTLYFVTNKIAGGLEGWGVREELTCVCVCVCPFVVDNCFRRFGCFLGAWVSVIGVVYLEVEKKGGQMAGILFLLRVRCA